MASNVVEYILDIKTRSAEKNLDRVEDTLEGVNSELKKTQKESKKTKSSLEEMKNIGAVLGKVGAAITAVAIAVAAVGVASFKAVKKVTDLTNELNDLSIRSGLTSKTIQALRQSLSASGQPAEGLNEILGAMAGQFAQLAIEGSEVEKKFTSLGIAIKDNNGLLRSNNDILLDGIKKLQSIGDASTRSRTAVLLFGEAGAKLNQALGAGNFDKFLSFTEKFGIDTGPRASKAAADMQKALSSLELIFNSTLQKIVMATNAQDKFTATIIKFGGSLAFASSLIKSFSDEINAAVNALLFFAKKIIQVMIKSVFPFIKSIELAIDAINVLENVIPGLSEVIDSLTRNTINAVKENTNLGNALDTAAKDATEFMESLNSVSLKIDKNVKGQKQIAKELNTTTKQIKEQIEELQTLNDVLDSFFRKFTNFNIGSFVAGFAVVFDLLNKKLNNLFDTSKIDRFANTLRKQLFGQAVKLADTDTIEMPSMVIEATKFTGFTEFLTKMKLAIAEIFSIGIKGLGAAGDKISSALSGGLSAGATTAITGIAAVLNIAKGLGERGDTPKEIKKSLEDEIQATAKGIEMGLEVLPSILFETLPPLLIEFVDRLIFGVLKGIAEQINLLINAFRSIFTREGRQERKEAKEKRKEARGEEFERRLGVLFDIISKRSGGRYIPSARGGIRFTGQDEGLAMLHRGEYVVPETGQAPQGVQRTMMGMGSGGVTININAAVVESNAVDELVRQIERRFSAFGSSTSPLFGGS